MEILVQLHGDLRLDVALYRLRNVLKFSKTFDKATLER